MVDAEIIKKNIELIRSRISSACRSAGRDPSDVRLMLATKTVPPDRIRIAIEAGCGLIGENKVQEFRAKQESLSDLRYERHYIGHLQTNKVNEVLNYVSCIHSVDSFHLAERIDKRLASLGRSMDVFIQVNTSYEESKFGIEPEKAFELVKQVATLESLNIRGLMTIGKLFATGDRARRCFRHLRQIRDEIADMGIERVDLRHLSMGMTPDFEEAIGEGATIVRIGSAVFGARPTPDGFFWNEQDRLNPASFESPGNGSGQ